MKIILALVFLPIISFGQDNNEKDIALGSVLYDFSYHFDTTDYNKVQRDIMELDFSKNLSVFYSKGAKDLDSTIKVETEQLNKSGGKGFVDFSLIARRMATNNESFFTDIINSTVYDQKKFDDQNYLVKNKTSVVNWEILDSTKKINNYTCQKAIGISTGRLYTVWFSTDLPYSFGPRRLFGLPGLILEAYDEQNRIRFTLKKINNNIGNSTISIPISNSIITDYTSYNKMVTASENMYKNGFKKVETSTIIDANGKTQTITKTTSGGSSSNSAKRNPYNYPLDKKLD
ncbi:MAG: hypothetical protein DI598_01190 [Pseudopedobacter saltans]|uniref:GLPGLI family protein n=1 Tax=Pseudopedobacter saltans TaxID=151895 RepID=A0A2W5H9R3_9SPHI|nr:MAG: hypothetical protein DI598_01190 [Pseudopedobacter saltans]